MARICADDPADELAEVARCLTVTAPRLKGLTLGRKFSGGTTSIAQRKQESRCAACGAKGHWQGDSECPHASSAKGGKSSGKAKTPSKNDAQTTPGKKVLTVQHSGGKRLVTADEETHGDQCHVALDDVDNGTFLLLGPTLQHTW